jgi:hypothetical protein
MTYGSGYEYGTRACFGCDNFVIIDGVGGCLSLLKDLEINTEDPKKKDCYLNRMTAERARIKRAFKQYVVKREEDERRRQ